eukprot:1198820-Rhodomonas_salina.2
MMMMQSDGAGCRRGHGDGERKRNDNDASRVCIEKEKGVVEEREEEGGVEGVETDVSFRVDARHNRSLLDAGRQVELLQRQHEEQRGIEVGVKWDGGLQLTKYWPERA